MKRVLFLGAVLAAVELPASAQGPARPDPANPAAATPTVPYRSVFKGYRPSAEAEVADWRETNDTVGKIGGWRQYLREAAQPEADGAPVPAATTPASAPPHSMPMHRHRGGHHGPASSERDGGTR